MWIVILFRHIMCTEVFVSLFIVPTVLLLQMLMKRKTPNKSIFLLFPARGRVRTKDKARRNRKPFRIPTHIFKIPENSGKNLIGRDDVGQLSFVICTSPNAEKAAFITTHGFKLAPNTCVLYTLYRISVCKL